MVKHEFSGEELYCNTLQAVYEIIYATSLSSPDIKLFYSETHAVEVDRQNYQQRTN